LSVLDDEHQHSFQLRDEGEVDNFLGIRIVKNGDGTFLLTQTGLIAKTLSAAGMEDCNKVYTPALPEPTGADLYGDPFVEDWAYASIIGMRMYLAANTRPDIVYAVHQAARHTHYPRASHALAVKRILCYLQGTKDCGTIFRPDKSMKVDCYVDADFDGLWKAQHDQDPICAKSLTGYVIKFCNVPVLWVSKMQTQIALSTMEAEYIALSHSIRDLIPIREALKEILGIVMERSAVTPPCSSYSKAFKDGTLSSSEVLPPSTVFEDNQACLKFAMMPKLSPRTKHIAVPYHWYRSKVINLEISVKAVSSELQLGDQFTKGLAQEPFERHH
jgi:hypothetical protein